MTYIKNIVTLKKKIGFSQLQDFSEEMQKAIHKHSRLKTFVTAYHEPENGDSDKAVTIVVRSRQRELGVGEKKIILDLAKSYYI